MSSPSSKKHEPSVVYKWPHEKCVQFFVERYEPGTLEPDKKVFRPYYLDAEGIRQKGYPIFAGGLRPLYNDPEAIERADNILVVEGEKAAIAASNRCFGRPWVVTTWAGGASAVEKSDWNTLHGKKVVIWPDKDQPGLLAANKIKAILAQMNVPSHIIQPPDKFPEKWDLAEPNPDGIDNSMIINMIIEGIKLAKIEDVPFDTAEAIANTIDEYSGAAASMRNAGDWQTTIDKKQLFQCLGFDKELKKFYFFSKQFGQVISLSASDLLKEHAYMMLCPNKGYWETLWDALCAGDSSKAKFSFTDLGWKLGSEFAKTRTIFDPQNIRGRGAWLDGGKFIFHIGDRLVVDGQELQHGELNSRYIYTLSANFLKTFDNAAESLSDVEGMNIIDACEAASFDNEFYSHLYAGWLVNALVCGALSWRPHIWLTGNAQSGKTEIQDKITSFVLNDFGIYPKGESTEAGIRINLAGDARPVVYDESESETREGMARIQHILSTMRVSSKESRGSVMKGTQTHGAVSFDVRSMYCLSSIGVGMKQQADISRVSVLSVSLPPVDTEEGKKERASMEMAFKDCVRTLHTVPNITCRLFLRVSRNINTHLSNIRVLSDVITKRTGSRRTGDQIGTLIAGFYLLKTTEPIDTHTATELMNTYDLKMAQVEKDTTAEDEEIITTIMGKTLNVEQRYSRTQKKVGYLMRLVSKREMEADGGVNTVQAIDALGQVGLKYLVQGDREGFLMALSREDYINDLMKDSRYTASWQKIMMRSHFIIPSEKQNHRIGGTNVRALWIDIKAFLKGEEKIQQSYSFPEEEDAA